MLPPWVTERNGFLTCQNALHELAAADRSLFWCSHIEEAIKLGEDASQITPGSTVAVPIFPASDINAMVEIKNEGPINFVVFSYTPEFGNTRNESLTLWNEGEGRFALRAVILDYVLGKLMPGESWSDKQTLTKCPARTHGMREQRRLEAKLAGNLENNRVNKWDIALENACIICVEDSSAPDDNFGLDGSQDPKAGSGGGVNVVVNGTNIRASSVSIGGVGGGGGGSMGPAQVSWPGGGGGGGGGGMLSSRLSHVSMRTSTGSVVDVVSNGKGGYTDIKYGVDYYLDSKTGRLRRFA